MLSWKKRSNDFYNWHEKFVMTGENFQQCTLPNKK